ARATSCVRLVRKTLYICRAMIINDSYFQLSPTTRLIPLDLPICVWGPAGYPTHSWRGNCSESQAHGEPLLRRRQPLRWARRAMVFSNRRHIVIITKDAGL